MVAALTPLLDHPFALAIAIVAATFVLEDAATIAVGLLAARMAIDADLALAALVTGTIAGDLGLYAIGRLAGRHRWIRARLDGPAGERIKRWLSDHALITLAVARFVPGTRLPACLGSGVIRVDPARAGAVIVAATMVWTPALFWASMAGGSLAAARLGSAAGFAALAALVVALLAPALVRRGLARCQQGLGAAKSNPPRNSLLHR